MPEIQEIFEARFPESTERQGCQVPGFVPLMGDNLAEHALPCLGACIELSVFACFGAVSAPRIRILSQNDVQQIDFELLQDTTRNAARDQVAHTLIAAILDHFNPEAPPGMLGVTDASHVPEAAGREAAIALAYALAYKKCLKATLMRSELADLVAHAAGYGHFPGAGIMLAGNQDVVIRVESFPATMEQVPALSGYRFALCVPALPTSEAQALEQTHRQLNRACSQIRRKVENYLQEDVGPEFQLDKLGHLWTGALCLRHDEVREVFEAALPAPGPDAVDLPASAWHILNEFEQVEKACEACLMDSAAAFTEAMDASWASQQRLLDNNAPTLVAVGDRARMSGALTVRLAGFGLPTAAVGLIPTAEGKHFTDEMTASDNVKEVIIANPGPGAAYIDFDS